MEKIQKKNLLALVLLAQVTLLLNFTMTDNNIKANTSTLVRMTPLSVERINKTYLKNYS